MFKKLLALLVFSAAFIFFMPYAQQGVQLLLTGHERIADALTNVFNGGDTGNMVRAFIALLSIPLIVGLIPAIIFWLIKRTWLSFFMDIVWFVWLIQAGALAVAFKATGAV
jgi:hypothetical protein